MMTGRPARFTADDVVRTALDLGIAEFTVSGVAASLGVTAPAIYRVFPSHEALTVACLRQVQSEFPTPPEDIGWRDCLSFQADVQWTFQLRYPGLSQVLSSISQPLGLRSDGKLPILQRLSTLGLSPSQAVFALWYIIDLSMTYVRHLNRQLGAFNRDLGTPAARVFRGADGQALQDAAAITESARLQFRCAVDFFLDGLTAVAPDFPEMTGPLGIPATPPEGGAR